MRAEIVGDEVKLFDCYRIKESVKEIAGRCYDADEKCWRVPKTESNLALLKILGFEITGETVTKATGREQSFDDKPCQHMPIRAAPYKHQISAFNFALGVLADKSKGVAYLMDMGTGKTITVIGLAGALFQSGKIKRMLVVAPLSIVSVWEQEFGKFADYEYSLAVLDGGTVKNRDKLRFMRGDGLQIAVVNYESAWRMEADLVRWKSDFIVCDESTKIKNPQARCSKAMHRLGKESKFNAILTGTPIVNNPSDFFSQYKFLNEKIFGASYYSFRAKYMILGGFQQKEIVGYKNLAELVEKAHAVAYRVKLADAVDLPETIDEVRVLALEPKAQSIYKSIEKESYAELMNGEISTRNVLTKLLRLSQVTGGFIRSDEGETVQAVSTAKLTALEDIIDTCMDEGRKIVVFARFLPEIAAIERLLKKKGIEYSLICGEVKDRAEEVRKFQQDDNVRVFVGQLATVSMGLTLTAAHIAVFYSLDFNYSNYEQSKARIHRIGQKEKCLYIHLVAKNTVDETIMSALKHKKDVATLIVDDYKKILGGGSG